MQVQLHRIRKILIHWRRILRITGGDLEISKTVVYYLDHIQEEDGRMRFKTIQESPGDIVMPAETTSEHNTKISRNDPDTAERYLGVRIAPTGQMETEFIFRYKQAKDLSVKLGQIYMTWPEATLAYQSRWLSIVGFFTPITCFTRRQCEQIHTQIYQVFLPKMGYNRNLPLAIRYGPKRYGGAGLTHTYTEQAIKHLQFLVGTIRQSSELSDMHLIALSTIQLIAGTKALFLNLNKKKHSYVHGNTRNNFLWALCNEFHLTMTIDSLLLPTAQRVGDDTLMDVLVARNITPEILQIMYRCCMYLRVIYLSDIVSADRKIILPWATHAKHRRQQKSDLQWPYQPLPSDSDWNIWKMTLLAQLGITTDFDNVWHLHQPLGQWLSYKSHIRRRYQVHLPTRHLWDTADNTVYRHSHHDTHYRLISETGTVPPTNMVPADVCKSRHSLHAQYDLREPSKAPSRPPNRPLTSLAHMEDGVQQFMEGFAFSNDDGQEMIRLIHKGDLVAACDGSVRGDTATYGYVFSDRQGDRQWKGYGRLPTTYHSPTSQRAEFYGVAAVVGVLTVICDQFQVHNPPPLQVYLDNQGVVDYQEESFITKGIKAHLAADTDINLFVKTLLKNIPLDIKFHWVKGHQDDTKDEAELSFEALLNIEADRMADIGYFLPERSY